jgi:REP element-mobilizing transposase RayT
LRAAFRQTRERHPFTTDAIVVLPDHLHAVWTLPDGDRDFSTRWRLIKSTFSRNFAKGGGLRRSMIQASDVDSSESDRMAAGVGGTSSVRC